MWFSPIFERFVEKSPVTVILRGLMEVVLIPSKLDDLFEQTAQTGYTKEILSIKRLRGWGRAILRSRPDSQCSAMHLETGRL